MPIHSQPIANEFHVHGVAFSQSGKELLSIIEITPNEKYTTALNHFLDQQGMIMGRAAGC